jgi:DNA segregation ATPase FtsK/SpoIIIE, S-DNA-T family
MRWRRKEEEIQMIFEVISTTIFGAISMKAYLSKSGVGNDSKKLNKVFALTGLNVKDGNQTLTTHLIKKRNYDWGTEYRYRIPLGRSFEDYLHKQKIIEAAVNTRSFKLQQKDLKSLKLDKNIIESIRTMYSKRLLDQKEIELSFDGMLIIRVYHEPLPPIVDFSLGEGWKVHFGVTRMKNKPIYHDFEKMPHFVLGGTSRYGKSNLINCIINSLIRQKPNDVKFHFIDLKGGIELSDYENIKQKVSIAYEPEEALTTLENAYNIMKEKQRFLKSIGKKKVEDAGITERHFVIIDEVGELNPTESVTREEKAIKQECQKFMSQIARLGAGLGFRMILATQYPTGDVIPRQCKQNSDAKLCFRVQSGTASRVVLDSEGAESLPQIKGRAIYQLGDSRMTLQTPLITPEIIEETIRPYVIPDKGVKIIETTKPKARTNSFKLEETRLS